jgi:hypothetical protein
VDEEQGLGAGLIVAQLVDIDTHGRLAPDEEARRVLADRAGRFALLPTAPDILLLTRRPAVGGVAPAPKCILAGDLSAFPVADFVAFMHQMRLSGLLTVATGGVERSISFKQGEVRGARSESHLEQIGEVVIRLGYVTREQLESIEPGAKLFGRTLVEKGYLKASELMKCLEEQVTAVFHAVLIAKEGVFHLLDQGDLEVPGVPLSIDTYGLLMDGIRRIDEMSLFTSKIPGAHAFLRRREPKRPITLQPMEQTLLDLVDGRRRVSDVAQAAHLSDFEALKILFHLAETGHVEAVTAPSADGPQPAGAFVAAADVTAAVNDALKQVAAAAERAGALDAALATARAWLAEPPPRYAPIMKRIPIETDFTLDETAVLGKLAPLRGAALRRLEPSGSGVRYLRESLRELLFLLLLAVGERLGPEEDEALALEVKRRLEAVGGLGSAP